MNLTTLKESYSTLLESFKEAGIVLNESQQGNLDNFMVALENKLVQVRDTAIRTTKKIVTEKLDREYQQLTESLIEHMEQNAEIKAKIAKERSGEKDIQTLAEAVDEYLGKYVEEVLPKKTIVDYTRMHKLESIHESLKNLLAVKEQEDVPAQPEADATQTDTQEDPVEPEKQEDTVEPDKTEQTTVPEPTVESETDTEELPHEEEVGDLPQDNTVPSKEDSDEVTNLKNQLRESNKTSNMLAHKVRDLKAKLYLETKTRDLPEREAKIVRESLKGASIEQIDRNFSNILESARDQVQTDMEVSMRKQEKNLEEAIAEIIGGTTTSGNENDGNLDDGNPTQPGSPETDDGIGTSEEDYAGEVIDESYMRLWMSRC